MQSHSGIVIFPQSRDHSSNRVLNSLELYDDKVLRPSKHSIPIVESGDHKALNEGFKAAGVRYLLMRLIFLSLKLHILTM